MSKAGDRVIAAFNAMKGQRPLPDDLELDAVLTEARFLFDSGYSPPSTEKDTLDKLAKALQKVEDLLIQGDDKEHTPGDINFHRMAGASDKFFDFTEDVRTFRKLATQLHIAQSKDGRKPMLSENDCAAIRLLAEHWDSLPGRKYSNVWINKNEPDAEGSCFLFVVAEELAPQVTPYLFNYLKTFKL